MLELRVKWRASPLLRVLYVGFYPTSGLTDPQISHANQVVSGDGKCEDPLNLSQSPVPGFAQTSYGLEPSEDLFNPLTLTKAHGVAIMTTRAGIDG